MFNLKNRNFLTLLDYTQKEIEFLIKLAKQLKIAKYTGSEKKNLKGKNIILLFEKDSTRTRCSFEVAAMDQGANVTYIGPKGGSQMGKKESIKDTARVLGRMYDAIEYRGYGQNIIETLAKYSGVPVWNGLTNEDHPTQVLADFLTIKEHFNKNLNRVKLTYVGDGRNNTANSLMIGASKMGMDFRIAAPRLLFPDKELVKKCNDIAQESGAKITITHDIKQAVKDADVIYTDVWLSMGEPESEWGERINLLKPYQVNMDMLKASCNPGVKFFHCLPSFHDLDTEVGQKIYEKYGLECMEVTNEVFESKYSLVFDEAENRMHTIKAVMAATLA
ncbi:ornithine carbamoyltransferase [Clostridium sp. JN-1]|jgi:ornithine carbamoyltransferase|uniref:ornithine carbamoyltransferase n=1 Tax=Clostridium sp. JN-1 TaxID=2483110 RepID=UPI000F0B8952|nr:ornithine carbamoyltransferase [Clostridium sp. JN-1]